MTNPLPTTKASRATTCSFPCSSNCRACLSLACTASASRPTSKAGFYQDPVSDYGRLSSELFRVVRLVVDTGIHAKGWSRDQVVDFFRKSGAVDEPTVQSETDRYIAWPAQALSYKLGQLKFRELRDRAQKELGSKFDIRKFHDEMLDGGTLPLDLLEARTDKWIAQQKTK